MTELVFIFWYWWVLALMCLVIEILVPSFFFLWLATSALITGALVWLLPALSMNGQVFVFSLLSVVTIVAWKLFGKKLNTETDQPLLNKRGAQYVGRTFNLHEAIVNGQGKIKVDDSIWKVHGKDCDINSRVKVVACRGTVFDVEQMED